MILLVGRLRSFIGFVGGCYNYFLEELTAKRIPGELFNPFILRHAVIFISLLGNIILIIHDLLDHKLRDRVDIIITSHTRRLPGRKSRRDIIQVDTLVQHGKSN